MNARVRRNGELPAITTVLALGICSATVNGRTKRGLANSGAVTGAEVGQWQRNSAPVRAVRWCMGQSWSEDWP